MIIDFDSFSKCGLDIPLAITSIPGDPIHPGHISCLQGLRRSVKDSGYNENFLTVCLVNDDNFLIKKKGFAFIPQEDRVEIINSIRGGADFVIPFTPSDPNDMTVIEAIRILKPKFFLKGGDRTADKTLPEWNICQEIGCKIIDHVGAEKRWSSSKYLENYKKIILKEL